MKKRIFAFLIVVSVISMFSVSQTRADPIGLDYQITDLGGGLYDYDFTLILDNHDASWAPGQGWAWLIFGDAMNNTSPLTAFVGDPADLPIGPWTYYTTSSGYHNGPTLGYVLEYWVPSAVGESLNWSGTSTAYLGQGELLYSTLYSTGGGAEANFEVAHLVPVPGAVLLACIGFMSCGISGIIRGRK